MSDTTPAEYLYSLLAEHLPSMVASGELVPVLRSPPDESDHVIDFMRLGSGHTTLIGSTHRKVGVDLALSLASLPRFTGRKRGPLQAAWALLPRHADLLLETYPACVATACSTYPGLYYDPALPGYLPFARGFNAARRHFHAGPPVASGGTPVRPGSPSVLTPLFERLGMSAAARARWVAFAVGTLLRHDLVAMPGLFLASPGKGTGKSTLGRLAASVYTGAPPAECAGRAWHGRTELVKSLAAQAGTGPLIHIDNINPAASRFDSASNATPGEFHSDDLACGTSEGLIKARVLGVSASVVLRYPVIICNAQQPKLSSDLADRFVFVLLDRPSPGHITDANDARRWIDDHADAVRAELVATLLDTTPATNIDADADNKARFGEWFRRVLPVVARYGLDPRDVRLQVDFPYTAPGRNLLASVGAAHLLGKPFTAAAFLAAGPHTPEWRSLVALVGHGRPPGALHDPEAEAGPVAALEAILARLADSPVAYANDFQRFKVARAGPGEWIVTAESWRPEERRPGNAAQP